MRCDWTPPLLLSCCLEFRWSLIFQPNNDFQGDGLKGHDAAAVLGFVSPSSLSFNPAVRLQRVFHGHMYLSSIVFLFFLQLDPYIKPWTLEPWFAMLYNHVISQRQVFRIAATCAHRPEKAKHFGWMSSTHVSLPTEVPQHVNFDLFACFATSGSQSLRR